MYGLKPVPFTVRRGLRGTGERSAAEASPLYGPTEPECEMAMDNAIPK